MIVQYSQNQAGNVSRTAMPAERETGEIQPWQVYKIEDYALCDARTGKPVNMRMNWITGLMEEIGPEQARAVATA